MTYFVDRKQVAHIFIAEDDVQEFAAAKGRGYKSLEGWVSETQYVCVSWSNGSIYRDERPLLMNGEKVGVKVKPTTTSIGIYLDGQSPGAAFKICELSPEECETFLGERVELFVIGPAAEPSEVGYGAEHGY